MAASTPQLPECYACCEKSCLLVKQRASAQTVSNRAEVDGTGNAQIENGMVRKWCAAEAQLNWYTSLQTMRVQTTMQMLQPVCVHVP